MVILFLPALLTLCVMLFISMANIFHFAPNSGKRNPRMWALTRFTSYRLRKSAEVLQGEDDFVEAAA